MLIYSLEKKLDEKDFGGKAAGLSRISQAGLSVPHGFAVHKKALEQFRNNNNIEIDLKGELEKVFVSLPGDKIIVRSSGIGEDSDDFSFAGQFDSFVVKRDKQAIIDAVKDCWSGLSNDRVKSYQQISGKKLTEMGVVIQEFVEAEYAGVLFTQSPYQSENIYSEYVKGGAEPLVSGRVTPESFSVTSDGKLEGKESLPFNHSDLISKAMVLKRDFGKELDIEWLFAGGEFYFVQARPIKVKPQDKVFWTSTNLNENYPRDLSPLLSSIARDSYYHYFKNLSKILQLKKSAIEDLEPDFSSSVGFFGNRIYYNMTSIHNIIAASPYHKYFKAAFNNFVGYKEKDASSKKFKSRSSILRLISRLILLNISLPAHVRTIEKKVKAYSDQVSNARGLKDLSACYHGFLNLRFYQWYHASLADLFSMIHYKLLGSFTKHLFGSEHTGIHNSLIQAIPGLISSKPLIASWEIIEKITQIPGGRDLFLDTDAGELLSILKNDKGWEGVSGLVDKYLVEWGFRCSEELMLNSDNYIDSPKKYVELLQSYLKSEQNNPLDTIHKKDLERKKLLFSAKGKIYRKRHIFFPISIIESLTLSILVRLCRKAIFYREQVRYRQAQMYYNFKTTVNLLGKEFAATGIIEDSRDIFFMNYKEIAGLISSSDIFARSYKGIISERKRIFNAQSDLDFPESFETNFGEQAENYEVDLTLNTSKELIGLAASGGKIRARAKVLNSVMEIKKLNKGDILVTRQTDPGWAMAFPIIGGLIVERGGALSHGAIVAREFGIPAVLGIDRVAEIIVDNDDLFLDGDTGKVKILS